jgi:hypothetical protein
MLKIAMDLFKQDDTKSASMARKRRWQDWMMIIVQSC